MRPRLYLHSLQSVTISQETEEVIFTTRHTNGRWYYFPLTKNQFLNFNDILTLGDSQRHTSGHFPLGKKLWLYYDTEVTLYRASKDNRPHFKFQSFPHYRRYVHERILSLLRSSNAPMGRQRRSNRASNAAMGKQRRSNRASRSINQRSLPGVVQTVARSPSPKRLRGEWESLPRSTNDAVVSHPKEESAIFPQRNNTNSRWRIESSSSSENEEGDSFDSVEVQLSDSYSADISNSYSADSMES